MEIEECTSCGRNLEAADTFVIFDCPDCETPIGRCDRCKKMSTDYECSECGFEGP